MNSASPIAWVYILKCADGRYYTGSHRGPDVAIRVAEHNAGADPKAFTFRRRPVELVWAQEFPTYVEMIEAERRIKGWSRAKKEAMMRGDWEEVSRLSRGTPRPSTSSG